MINASDFVFKNERNDEEQKRKAEKCRNNLKMEYSLTNRKKILIKLQFEKFEKKKRLNYVEILS